MLINIIAKSIIKSIIYLFFWSPIPILTLWYWYYPVLSIQYTALISMEPTGRARIQDKQCLCVMFGNEWKWEIMRNVEYVCVPCGTSSQPWPPSSCPRDHAWLYIVNSQLPTLDIYTYNILCSDVFTILFAFESLLQNMQMKICFWDDDNNVIYAFQNIPITAGVWKLYLLFSQCHRRAIYVLQWLQSLHWRH